MFSFSKFIFPILLLLVACQTPKTINTDEIIHKAVQVSGFDTPIFSINFDFREYHYELIRRPSFYSYSRLTTRNGVEVKDIMTSNDPLKRYLDDVSTQLSYSTQRVYSNSLNAVMYFFQLPKPLQDAAVIKEINGSVIVNDKSYWSIKVTFQKDGGGEDFQDEYRYWINQETYEVDFLAYNYQTDGGGTRFRKAINRREIDGFLFQDYENYKPSKKFEPLDSLPVLFEQGYLKQVSLIRNKNIRVVK